ncbi:MAG TPA: hypothetical protein VLR92_02565 [Blastocatellia bacterium]|nr:hypothetical protein [Blastocatellia bacterium]
MLEVSQPVFRHRLSSARQRWLATTMGCAPDLPGKTRVIHDTFPEGLTHR